jgi:hypothetical protein
VQACDFLTQWPTLAAVQRARPSTIRQFYRAHNCRKADVIEARLAAIASAEPLTTDAAVIEPLSLSVQTYATQLRTVIEGIQVFDARIAAVFAEHADHDIFGSFPGAGDVCAPRLAAAFGTDRSRWDSAAELQAHAGIAPVTERSGKSLWVHHRLACPKCVKQTFHEFADQSIRFSRWARAYYDQQRPAATIITPRCGRWLINGCGSCFAAGRSADPMTKRRTSMRCDAAGPRSPNILLDGATQMSMPPAPSAPRISTEARTSLQPGPCGHRRDVQRARAFVMGAEHPLDLRPQLRAAGAPLRQERGAFGRRARERLVEQRFEIGLQRSTRDLASRSRLARARHDDIPTPVTASVSNSGST